MAKPHPGVFEHAIAQASQRVGRALAPGEVLMVSDSRASDIDGAVAAGWQAVWVGGHADDAPPGVRCIAKMDGFAV